MLQQSFRLPEKSNVLFNIFWPVRVDKIKQENTLKVRKTCLVITEKEL